MSSGSPNLRSSDREFDSLLHSMKKSQNAGMRSRGDYLRSPTISEHTRPLSKYDHRPRNVEFDGRNFVMSTRRQSSHSHRERKGKGRSYDQEEEEEEEKEEVVNSVSISELECGSDDDALTHAVGLPRGQRTGVKGQTVAGGRGKVKGVGEEVRELLRWFVKTSKPRLALLAAMLGLVFGIGYRGGLGSGNFGSGLYLGWFPKGTL